MVSFHRKGGLSMDSTIGWRRLLENPFAAQGSFACRATLHRFPAPKSQPHGRHERQSPAETGDDHLMMVLCRLRANQSQTPTRFNFSVTLAQIGHRPQQFATQALVKILKVKLGR
ncbi:MULTISPECIES: hypothetical protein [Paraburkholderia]|uniref:Uncharacterized protein n=2 Tax=Paraburkholderia TaxID=1822464 RepID=A0A7Y9WU82_9BURK|nr:hypothetical protein [Paraburkholderia bryophila]NYH27224.1 hypothetical protein [Paraburkholderia bryophila]